MLRCLLSILLLLVVAVAPVCAQALSVPAEQGGPGFETIAASLGFETYTPKKDELYYFGDPAAKTGGALRLPIGRFPFTFRPVGQSSNLVENSIIQSLVYETLLSTHPLRQTSFVPALASHWKVSEDKKTFTFRINPGARFSNGKPVTARDVAATWHLVMDETILEPSLQLTYGVFSAPKQISTYIVELTAREVNFRNLLYFACSLPILSADEIGNMSGAQFIKKYTMTMPVGSGEYIIRPGGIVEDVSYTLTRRDDYWAKDYPLNRYSGNFDTISYRVIGNTSGNKFLSGDAEAEYESFLAGETDVVVYRAATNDKWVSAQEPPIAKGWIHRYRVYNDAPVGVSGIAFNLRRVPFDDIRVRKAFVHLFDRKTIIKTLLADEYKLQDSYYANTPYAFTGHHAEYDPQKAAQLLAEAGWTTKNEKGILIKDGKPLIVTIRVPEVIKKYMLPYQVSLRGAGIDLQVEYCEGWQCYSDIMTRDFSLAWINWGGLAVPNPVTSWHSALAGQQDNNNISGVSIPRIDELCAMYDTTFSTAGQEQIIREIDSIVLVNYVDVLAWNPKGIRIGAWSRFGMPKYMLPRFTQFGYVDLSIMQYWWYDEKKAQALEQAEREGKPLRGKNTPHTIDYWKVRRKK